MYTDGAATTRTSPPQFERYAERGHRVVAADEAQPRSEMSRFHEMFPDILYGKAVGSGISASLKCPSRSMP